VRRFLRRVGPEWVETLLQLREADIRGGGTGKDPRAEIEPLRARVAEELAHAAALKVSDLVIGGAEVMQVLGVPPGPIVGRVLGRLLDRVLEEPALNTREQLLALVPAVAVAGPDAK
jgi:tRNA nucleotidyltransferase (CCA-adding enzyme)